MSQFLILKEDDYVQHNILLTSSLQELQPLNLNYLQALSPLHKLNSQYHFLYRNLLTKV